MSWRWAFNTVSPAGKGGRLSVLIFHRVRPEVDPLFPNEPDAESFEAQMRWVQRWFNVLPLAEAVARLRTGSLPARAMAITFDDGYADNCTVAMPILRGLGLHATFFIASGYLDGGRMWNDTIIETMRVAPEGELDLSALQLGVHRLETPATRAAAALHIIQSLKYFALEQRERLAQAVATQVGQRLPDNLMLTTIQLRRLHQQGMGIGAHTVSHPILSALPTARAREEIVAGKTQLEALIGVPVRLFAYPNGKPGRDYTADHVRMVREAGFDGALSTAWGTARFGGDPYQLPRFTPWDRRTWSYALRLLRNLRRPDHAIA